MKEGQTQEAQVDDFVASLNAQLGISPGGKSVKPQPKLTPEQAFEAQWKAVATVLSVDVRTCQSCGSIHSMPIGFFLEQTHQAVSLDRRLTQIKNSIHSMPESVQRASLEGGRRAHNRGVLPALLRQPQGGASALLHPRHHQLHRLPRAGVCWPLTTGALTCSKASSHTHPACSSGSIKERP